MTIRRQSPIVLDQTPYFTALSAVSIALSCALRFAQVAPQQHKLAAVYIQDVGLINVSCNTEFHRFPIIQQLQCAHQPISPSASRPLWTYQSLWSGSNPDSSTSVKLRQMPGFSEPSFTFIIRVRRNCTTL